jgi:molybdopterin converting factor small subunit
VKLYGVFGRSAHADDVSLELPTRADVKAAIAQLLLRPHSQELKQLLVEGDGFDPRPNALIMVSGREIGSLNGLETELKDDDELTLLPIAHGGRLS